MSIWIGKPLERDVRAIEYQLHKEIRAEEQQAREIMQMYGGQYRPGQEKGFWNNRNLIRDAHRKGELYVLRENDRCVAFHFKNDKMGILWVRADRRHSGYGTILANLWIGRARADDEPYVAVKCAPKDSQRFWRETMGFTTIETHDGLYAYRILNKYFPVDGEAALTDVQVSFYASRDARQSGDEPVHVYRTHEAGKLDNHVQLSQRVICMEMSDVDKLAVEIIVDGKVVYFGRAGSAPAKALGIKTCCNDFYTAYYVDSLTLPDSASTDESLTTNVEAAVTV